MSNITQYSNFEVEVSEQVTPFGTKTHTDLVFRRNLDPDVIKYLTDILDTDEVYNDPVKICPEELYPHIKDLNKKVQESEAFYLLDLSEWLGEYFKGKIEQLDRLEADGKINFSNLEQIFKIGTKCIGNFIELPIGFIVSRTERTVDSFGLPVFAIYGKVTVSRGDKFIQYDKSFTINSFGGAQYIKNLPVRPINDEELTMLTERGRKYVKYALSSHFVSYTGNMMIRTMYGYRKFKADGRIMIDPTGFNKKIPGYNNYRSIVECESVPEDLMFMCSPYTYGFSFVNKSWGEVLIDNVSDIVYDDNAFDYLVLDENIKEMVKALVINSSGAFSDIISNKSGGTIFCLAGVPGTGKTLLSESIAELLHKPLYSVTVGELGITPDVLEKKLQEILEIANGWDAVILIDEADIFMEKRAENDIVRNAMVSVFLRLLEHHQGIMFLTTNRIENFDEAFYSRISISIKFNQLEQSSRYKIWTNLLKAAKITIDEKIITQLSDENINGRQIKSCIRMAQCLAKDKNEDVSIEHFKKVLPFII